MATRDEFAAFSAGISKHLGIEINEYPQIYSRYYQVDTSDAKFVDFQLWEGYGAPGLKNPGMQGEIGQVRQSYNKRFVHQSYFLGDIITQEDWDDDKYGVLHRLIPSKGGSMARSFRTLKEVVHANYLINNAFTATTALTTTTGDGLSLLNTAHPLALYQTATGSNRTSVDADLSIATAQFMITNLKTQKSANNYEYGQNRLAKLLVHPSLVFVAKQCFKGAWERATADRNTNYIPEEGDVEIIQNPYFTASGATGSNNSYIGFGDTNYLMSYDRTNYKVNTDHDIITDSIIFASTCRFSLGAIDWRGLVGSAGK